jgi:Rrf2 family transcriptional regulator, cysteine metabolism repressor
LKISTKGQYALEALLDLQLHAVNGQENLGNIARRRGISEHYLEQIFNTLRKAGIVESFRGAQGGYRLQREPQSITVGEVLRALEGVLSPVKCVCSVPGEEVCGMAPICSTRGLWLDVSNDIDEAVNGITLLDLVSAYQTNPQNDMPEYSI